MSKTPDRDMCHLMRTQIGIIIGLVEIINLHDDNISDQSREDLQRVRIAANAMLDLVKQVEQQSAIHFI